LGDSPVWADLLKVKNIYLKGREVIVKNGKSVVLWTDKWSPSGPICVKAPILFELSTEKDVTIGEFHSRGGSMGFRRWLPNFLYDQWLEAWS
jgi:hypothetical protein